MLKQVAGIFMCICVLPAAGAGRGAAQAADGGYGLQATARIQSFFIPNEAAAGRGKILPQNPEVSAFLQTPRGRILFSSQGGFIGLPAPAFSTGPDGSGSPREGRGAAAGDSGQTVVLANQPAGRVTEPELQDPSGAVVNFLYGKPENWRTGVPAYRRLVYRQVWPGVDMEYAITSQGLECRWILQPGADPARIRMQTGGEELALAADGGLMAERSGVQLGFGPLRILSAGAKSSPAGPVSFRPLENGEYGLAGLVQPLTEVLILASGLSWSTFLGSPGNSEGTSYGVAVETDTTGNIYVAGITGSDGFPATAGVFQAHAAGYADGFVLKFNPSGQLLFSTFLGGSNSDTISDLALGPGNTIFLAGKTASADFPVTAGAYDTTFTGRYDAFVVKLGNNGNILLYSTLLGGDDTLGVEFNWQVEEANGIAVDNSGQAYVCGGTSAVDFPVTAGSWGQTPGGSTDAFVVKFNSAGSALLFSRRLAGSQSDNGQGLNLGHNSVHVTGWTTSADFPITPGAVQTSFGGDRDIFFSRLDLNGNSLQHSTYLGGNGRDEGVDIAVDGNGNAILTGTAGSADFPVTPGAYDTLFSSTSEAFAAKIGPAGSLVFSTLLGGDSTDYGYAVKVSSDGIIYLAGYTMSNNFPVTAGAWKPASALKENGYLAVLGTLGKSLLYSTVTGGGSRDWVNDLAVDSSGNAVLTGLTESTDYPVTPDAFCRQKQGTWDAFVTKINSGGNSLVFSTRVGGAGGDDGVGIATDAANNVYVAGNTRAATFPATAGAFDTSLNGGLDVFAAKLSGSTGSLIYATFLGGSGTDDCSALAVSPAGEAYLTGTTDSDDFPLTPGVFDQTPDTYHQDIFLTKLDSGGHPAYSTLLGGASLDSCYAIALDNQGRAYLTGNTFSSDFPTTGLNREFEGSFEGFVTRFNASGTGLSYSTFLRGGNGKTVCVDGANQAYVAGWTSSNDLPVTAGAWDTALNGKQDGFALKINAAGTALLYSTFLGGTEDDVVNAIRVDASGQLYLTGKTTSTDFPVTPGAYGTVSGGAWDGFVTKLNATGSALAYSTYLGGDKWDIPFGLAIDASGRTWVAGESSSANFPVSADAWSSGLKGSLDAALTRLNSTGTTLEYSTYLGGSFRESANAVALDGDGNVLVTGTTYSPDFPLTAGALDPVNYGQDAFVCKLIPRLTNDDCTVGGLVGVGTTSPERALHLSGGNAVFRMDRFESASAFLMVRTDAGGAPLKGFLAGTEATALNDGQFVFRDTSTAVTDGAGTNRMIIKNDGTAEFSGDVRAKSFITTSTARLKEQIRPLVGVSAILGGLRGVRYRWNQAAGLAAGLADVGFIAEELARPVPEAVKTNPSAGQAGVEYGKVLAIALESMKDQQLRLDAIARQRDAIRYLLRLVEQARHHP